MKNKTLILLGIGLLALSACGKREKKLVVEPAYLPYFNAFVATATKVQGVAPQISDLTIKAGATGSSNVLASCVTLTEDEADEKETTLKSIVVSSRWAELSEAQRHALITHELGHCVFGSGHQDQTCSNGNPMSVMNKYLISTYTGEQFVSYYTAQLLGVSMKNYNSPCDYPTPSAADSAVRSSP